MTHILSFMAGVCLLIALFVLVFTFAGKEKRRIFDTINIAFTLKLDKDISYKQYCTDDCFLQVETGWPSEANSFHVVIDDRFLGGDYVGKAFFDTGDVFYVEASVYGDGIDRLVDFKKMKWPDRKRGDTYWKFDLGGKK